MKNVHKILIKNLEGNTSECLDVDGKIILKYILSRCEEWDLIHLAHGMYEWWSVEKMVTYLLVPQEMRNISFRRTRSGLCHPRGCTQCIVLRPAVW
jgi:hypothetical protein